MDLDYWIPIGPLAVLKGQATRRPVVSGRVNGIAFGQTTFDVYVASANGGIWHTGDDGLTWKPLMEGYDLDPHSPISDSLACGAVAVAPGAGTGGKDRIYVGSGEPYNQYQPSEDMLQYFGVGPLVSSDGGNTWDSTEACDPATATLKGKGFYRLVADPGDPHDAPGHASPGDASVVGRVVAATTAGLFMRVSSGAGFVWRQQRVSGAGPLEPFCGLAAARDPSGAGGTFYYAAKRGGGCYRWDSQHPTADWAVAGSNFPTTDANMIALGMQEGNPNVVYALIAKGDGFLNGVWRLDTTIDTTWRQVSGAPSGLFGEHNNSHPNGQGYYDIAIAVDPTNANRIYLGGSAISTEGAWNGALYRCDVSVDGSTPHATSMVATFIGTHVHPDIHTLAFPPRDADDLWVGCDGGVFSTDNASGQRHDDQGHTLPTTFVSHNGGLATLEVVRLGLHPTEPGILYAGTQDNGTIRYTGGEVWEHVGAGDGGGVLVHPRHPRRILRGYTYEELDWATDAAQDPDSFHTAKVPVNSNEKTLFYPPFASPPYDPAHSADADADIVVFGSERVWLSHDFGGSWSSIPHDDYAQDCLDGATITSSVTVSRLAAPGSTLSRTTKLIHALACASPTLLYAGTTLGSVYRFAYDGHNWQVAAINTVDVPANPITSIAIDPADATGNSIFITIGGLLASDGYKRVLHCAYDAAHGTPTWAARSGPSAGDPLALLDVHHSVIVADTAHPDSLFVGTDIGVWHSEDGGQHWGPYSFSLPDAAVTDLKIHQGKRLLFAGTHGRGVYVTPLDSPDGFLQETVRLLLRDTQLDTRYVRTFDVTQSQSAEGGVDPTSRKGRTVEYGTSPDIRVDMPDSDGHYSTTSASISAIQFERTLSTEKVAHAYVPGTGAATNRVYVQVHNRGSMRASSVAVTLLLAQGTTPPDLTTGDVANIRAGTAITTGNWRTVGTVALTDPVGALAPGIAEFDLTSGALQGHGDWCLLAIASYNDTTGSADNLQYNQVPTSAPTSVRTLCANLPLAAYKRLSTTSSARSGPGFLHRAALWFAHILEMIPIISPIGSAIQGDDDPAAQDINPADT